MSFRYDVSLIHDTPFTLMRLKLRFSAVLRIFFVAGRLRLSYGKSQNVYVMIAVNTVPSRSSRYICGVLPFSAVLKTQSYD